MKTFLLLFAAALLQSPSRPRPDRTPMYTYKVVNIFPHDPQAFTQGLFFRDGFLYEGTGLNGRSSLRKVRIETGEVVQKVDLPAQFFGEGIAPVGDEIVQLTWK